MIFPRDVFKDEVGSPEWWVEQLDRALNDRQANLRTYGEYYDGVHPLLFATEKFRKAFGNHFRAFADNWTGIVVDAVDERLKPKGFRLGNAKEGDTKIWDIWQRNQLDADSQLAHNEALVYGDAYALVWPEDGQAKITIESPRQTIVAKVKGDRRQRAAALKVWVEEDGHARATLYLPDFLYKLQSRVKASDGTTSAGLSRWEARVVDGEDWPLRNPFGVVPVVPLLNDPTLLGWGGRSEIRNVIPIQDAINKLVADMIVASEFGAFRQRWSTGTEAPVDPETNQVVDDLVVSIARTWRSPNENAKFGDFEQTDLTNFVKPIETLVQHVASQSRTPPHYFYLTGQFPSGEALKSAETGLVAKARRKMVVLGEAWESVMALALEVEGSKAIRKQAHTMETIWADPESRIESELVDSLVKLKALNVPDEILWEKYGLTPAEIKRAQEINAANPPQGASSFTNGAPTETPEVA